jgi:hypothetical protein
LKAKKINYVQEEKSGWGEDEDEDEDDVDVAGGREVSPVTASIAKSVGSTGGTVMPPESM